MYRVYLAHRFMLSRKINLLGVVGVMLGVWALIVVVSIFDGVEFEMRRQFKMATSDLVVYGLGPQADYKTLAAAIAKDANVKASSPRLVWHGLLHPRSEKELRAWMPGELAKHGRFTNVIGVDPERELATTSLAEWLAAPEQESLRITTDQLKRGAPWILVSSRKAASKQLRKGDPVKLTIARTHHQPTGPSSLQFLDTEFVVRGAFKTHHAGYDNVTTIVSIDRLRDLIAQSDPDFVNEIAIAVHDKSEQALLDTRARLSSALAMLPYYSQMGYEPSVQIAGEKEEHILDSIRHQAGLMSLVLGVIMIVAGFLIYATLSMMVTEKKHDIGVLAALGGTKRGIMQVFFSTGWAISLLGTVLGLLSGALTSIYLNDFNEFMKYAFEIDLFPADVYNLPGVPYRLDAHWMITVAVSSVALGMTASAIPALRAMRNDPLECLRNQ